MLETKDHNGDTPLLSVIRHKNKKVFISLKENGANLFCKSKYGENAVDLLLPEINRWEDIFDFLPQDIVNQLITTDNGESILHKACKTAKPQ